MKHMAFLAVAALVPATAVAQQDPIERLGLVLPPDVASEVIERLEAARARDLPVGAAANLALEGVAKGRGAEEVLAAVEVLVADMGRALEAFRAAGREPVEGDVEAATAAMRMGVDAATVRELAATAPSGRALAIPLLVIGGLADRGLPSDEALTVVRDRLAARGGDAGLLGDFPEAGLGLARGRGPGDVGPGLAGFEVPVSGVTVPVGPPTDAQSRGRGRGRGPGGG